MNRSIVRLAGLLALLAAVALPVQADVAGDAKKYRKLSKKISVALEHGNYPKALKRFERQIDLAPGTPGVRYNQACALALAGHTTEALDALAKAAELGSMLGDHAGEDPDLESLRDHARFESIVQTMHDNETAWNETSKRRHAIVDPGSAPRFDTLEALTAAFESRQSAIDEKQALVDWTETYQAEWKLTDQKIAALARYIEDHPDASDLELAAIERVRSSIDYNNRRDPWGVDDGMFAYSQARSFLGAYPDSEHAAEALLIAGQARLLARPIFEDDEQDPESAADRKARFEAAEREFAALITDHVGSEPATKACMWRMRTAYERAGKRVTPDVEDHYQSFCNACGENENILDYAWERARGPLFELEAGKFHAVDLDGNEWTRESMAGKVVLVDFWATWCSPCMQELPNLKEAYGQYADQGFEILGISLDGEDREAFLASLDEHGIVWPQVYDGQGWDADLARRYRINGIPATVLLDRDGSVADLDLRGEALAKRVEELVAP